MTFKPEAFAVKFKKAWIWTVACYPITNINVLISYINIYRTQKIRKWLVTANMASPRANHAWQIWWPSAMELQNWWIREKQLTSSAWTHARHLTLSHTTSLCLNWGEMDLTDAPLSGYGIGLLVTLKGL